MGYTKVIIYGYSTDRFAQYERDHVNTYRFRVFIAGSKDTLFEISCLGLDRGQAIGRLRTWIGTTMQFEVVA